jgi:hypothetical protein
MQKFRLRIIGLVILLADAPGRLRTQQYPLPAKPAQRSPNQPRLTHLRMSERAAATEAAAIERADAVDKVLILLSTSPSEGPYDNVLPSSAVSGFWGCRHNQRIPRSGTTRRRYT